MMLEKMKRRRDDSRDNRRERLHEILYARVQVGQPSYHGQDDYRKKSGLHAASDVHDYGHGSCTAAGLQLV